MKIQFQDINLEVIPDKSHEWLLETALVAKGYEISPITLRRHKMENAEDLIEGRHFLRVTNLNAQNYGLTLPPKVREQTFWTKRGVITLGFFIRSEKARQFRQWAEDLILKVLDHHEPPIDKIEVLEQHTKREVQVQNSKGVNSYIIRKWGVETDIEYNRRNCRMVSGYSPSELRKIGKARGLKSKQYSSGKEVLRSLKPELAAQMSINDDLVQSGVRLTVANSLSAPCVPLLTKMIELKMLKV